MTDDPREAGPRPPFPGDQQQERPGLTSKMTPRPDHGEESYVGKGLLAGQAALITGGDSGIGGRWRSPMPARAPTWRSPISTSSKGMPRTTKAWVEKAGRRCLLLPGDIRDEASAGRWWTGPWPRSGGSTSWSNNAAAQVVNEGLDDLKAADIEGSFRANVFAMYYSPRPPCRT